jgi:ABC-type sugar transport system substrate-binding protein
MESLLKQYDNINVVYCENDNEAFGAIDALTAAGKTVGSDIKNGQVMVMSFDSTKAGLSDVLAGKITLDTECNPLHGPRVEEIIKKLQAGETVDHLMYVDEAMFGVDDTVKSVDAQNSAGDTVTYDITPVTQDVIDGRAY